MQLDKSALDRHITTPPKKFDCVNSPKKLRGELGPSGMSRHCERNARFAEHLASNPDIPKDVKSGLISLMEEFDYASDRFSDVADVFDKFLSL